MHRLWEQSEETFGKGEELGWGEVKGKARGEAQGNVKEMWGGGVKRIRSLRQRQGCTKAQVLTIFETIFWSLFEPV